MPVMQNAPDRVSVTLPDEVKNIFAWLKNHDERFNGADAAIAAFLLKKGAEAYYREGLDAITPMDNAAFAALSERSASGIRESASEERETAFVAMGKKKKNFSRSRR